MVVGPRPVRKVLIPAAGLGTRMFPATKAVKKELFPVVTPDGTVKPLLMLIVEEALRAGIEDVGIVVRPADEGIFRSFFSDLPDYFARLKAPAQALCRELQAVGERLTFIHQATQEGFGHAVYCAREWAAGEPVLLMLGDHLYGSSRDGKSCARQLVEAYEAHGGRSVVGLYVAEGAAVTHYGTVTGSWLGETQKHLAVSRFEEKPSLDFAREHLAMEGFGEDRFLCIYGQYVLTPAIFDHLHHHVVNDIRQRGEIQLTTALERLRADEGVTGCIVEGAHYDTGQPVAYLESLKGYYAEG